MYREEKRDWNKSLFHGYPFSVSDHDCIVPYKVLPLNHMNLFFSLGTKLLSIIKLRRITGTILGYAIL